MSHTTMDIDTPNDKSDTRPAMQTETDSTYTNRWFSGRTSSDARQRLMRWTEDDNTNDQEFCGTMYGHYFNYKVSRCIHHTKRDGRMDFFDKFRGEGYVVLKHVFRSHILKIIQDELMNAEKLTWVYPDISHDQVKTHLLAKTRLENPRKHGRCVFLHHFLSTVVAGTFQEKVFWEAAIMRTELVPGARWKPCTFHEDLTHTPPEMLNNAKSPITLYMPIEDQGLTIDLVPHRKKRGPKAKHRTVHLQAGDVLIFDTCATSHRTSTPINPTTPDRLNLVMTGFKSYLNFTLDDENENWGEDDSE
jgi:hypothetical protein